MKMFVLFVAVFSLQSHAAGQKISISKKNAPLKEIFETIEKKTQYLFIYETGTITPEMKATISIRNAEVDLVMQQCLENHPLSYSIVGKNIIISKSTAASPIGFFDDVFEEQEVEKMIAGRVTDSENKPLEGVSVIIIGTQKGTATDNAGRYSITVDDDAKALVFSMVGYETTERKITGTTLDVKMIEKAGSIEEVIITGIVERQRESFTGAVSTFTGDDLKNIGNDNIIQSLKTLDPSFIIIENNSQGSNPNTKPNIEIRGKTSISSGTLQGEFGADPNLPLFVLDGFETDLQTIIDLDMNRVASITVLKDAASTALYGAKAANGVVVVETKDPVEGRLRVTYTGDFRFEAPDLRSYNLMNAEEKLEFELLSGRYENGLNFGYSYQPPYDSIYNLKLIQVRRGVNTYWLTTPLHNGFTNGHSLYAEGGDKQVRYGLGVNYKNVEGIMKGSGRKLWGANFDINYRKNKLNIFNKLYINGSEAIESPYGSFSEFSRANPYFKARDDSGRVTRLLETSPLTGTFDDIEVANPLYNALLDNRNNTTGLTIQNRLGLIWSLTKDLRVQSSLQLRKGSEKGVIYIPPEHTMFDGVDLFQKGRYTETRIDNFIYSANVMLTYAKVFAGIHRLTGNLRSDVEQTQNDLFTSVATGFPLGSNGDPGFSFGYQPNSKPRTANRLYRRNNILASVNYSYDNRYLLDATYRLDGSTAFGSANKYSPFWSVGLGWNLSNENFLKQSSINTLRIRGNIGETGNQNFGSITSVSVYSYNTDVNQFGQGVSLSGFENPDLAWQKTLSTSLGIDMVMMGNRLSATLNGFKNYTNPLIVIIDLPSSTGIYGYATNAGNMTTKGVEANIRFSPIFKRSQGIIWTLGFMGSIVRSEYGEFGNKLESLNKDLLENSSLIRYKDGNSPDDIWAIKSMGIDPATGQEVFLQPDGKYTFDYRNALITVVGNTRPVIEGVFSSNLNYKGLIFGLNFRYRFGGDVFNTALYNKVENISAEGVTLNQDKRAFYDRWQKPGDVVGFKSISLTDFTPISSRFVQEENVIVGESFNVGYQFENSRWIEKLGIQSLRLNAYMNDILRVSSILAERGIDYPFSRAVSASVSITF